MTDRHFEYCDCVELSRMQILKLCKGLVTTHVTIDSKVIKLQLLFTTRGALIINRSRRFNQTNYAILMSVMRCEGTRAL